MAAALCAATEGLERKLAKSLKSLLGDIRRLERQFLREAQNAFGPDIYVTHFFLLSAGQRALALSRGFRQTLSSKKNFSCAAVLLRAQIDNAMRLNGLKLIEGGLENKMLQLMAEHLQFDKLKTTISGKRVRLTDKFLRQQLGCRVSVRLILSTNRRQISCICRSAPCGLPFQTSSTIPKP